MANDPTVVPQLIADLHAELEQYDFDLRSMSSHNTLHLHTLILYLILLELRKAKV